MFLTIDQRITATDDFTGGNGGSTGTITTVAAAGINQGELFRVRARYHDVFTFVFDKVSGGSVIESAFTRRVDLVGAVSAADVRDRIIAAINRTPGLALYASSGGAAQVNLLNALGGTAGNLAALADTVGGAFACSAMTGGVDYPSPPVEVDGIKMYPPTNFGGIFDFEFTLKRLIERIPVTKPALWSVDRIFLQTTGATDYTLNILAPDGTVALYQTGAGGVVLITTPLLLAGDERLQLITTGGTLAMFARVTARPFRLAA